MINLDW